MYIYISTLPPRLSPPSPLPLHHLSTSLSSALAGPDGLAEDTFRDAIIALETKVSVWSGCCPKHYRVLN